MERYFCLLEKIGGVGRGMGRRVERERGRYCKKKENVWFLVFCLVRVVCLELFFFRRFIGEGVGVYEEFDFRSSMIFWFVFVGCCFVIVFGYK